MTLTAACLAVAAMGAQAAPAVFDTGLIKMGVGDTGGLGQGTGTGLVGPTGDAITPGCLCEGWGAAANGTGNYTYGASGTSGFTTSTTTSNGVVGAGLAGNTVSTLANGLQVTHTYSYAAGGKLFKVAIEMKNTTAATVTDVRYARTLDWDVSPGFFGGNFTTVFGGPGGAATPGDKLLHTSTDPFDEPNPMAFRTQEADTNVTDTPGDKGGYFVFGFGDLDAGASVNFETYIGADESVAGLVGALASVGVEAYSYTTGNRPDGTTFAPAYGYGFVGLGLPPIVVPEPGSLALAGLALLGLAAARRRAA
jgi:type IV pilus assembly protein PilY1